MRIWEHFFGCFVFSFYYAQVIAQGKNEKLNVVFILQMDLGWSDFKWIMQ